MNLKTLDKINPSQPIQMLIGKNPLKYHYSRATTPDIMFEEQNPSFKHFNGNSVYEWKMDGQPKTKKIDLSEILLIVNLLNTYLYNCFVIRKDISKD